MAKDPVTTLKSVLTGRLGIDLRKTRIDVRLEGRSLMMEGRVKNVADKKRALSAAMSITGVDGVIDRLRVRPSARMTDAEIQRHVADALGDEPTLTSFVIKADVDLGVVDLEGQVGSLAHKRLAGVFAWWVPGVVDVINSIEVVPPEEDNDDEVSDAVKLVLEKDGLVHPSSMGVFARDYAVTLFGSARSDAERDAAEEDAWRVWGVNDVVNNLTVEKTASKAAPARDAKPGRTYHPHRLPLRKA